MSIEEVECLIIGGSHDGTRYRVPSDITLWRIPRRGQASHHSVNYDPLITICGLATRITEILTYGQSN